VRIAVLNGPSLNLLGTREPELYGTATLADVEQALRRVATELSVELEFEQRNGEGELIDLVHAFRGRVDGAVINAAAYSHTSLALRDALVAVAVPFVEVHLTNVYARETIRRRSLLSSAAVGVVCGFGPYSYEAGLRALVQSLKGRG
jgi:3-dehydroquinate dehydratase II